MGNCYESTKLRMEKQLKQEAQEIIRTNRN